jgi:hypothetical protein
MSQVALYDISFPCDLSCGEENSCHSFKAKLSEDGFVQSKLRKWNKAERVKSLVTFSCRPSPVAELPFFVSVFTANARKDQTFSRKWPDSKKGPA